ncbi:MAG: hypothetical protein KAH46_06920 [Mycobacterium sp.]|nr:hypothetical protein [Mycobacterium sp.]
MAGCSEAADAPATFAAVVTVVGDASQGSAETGECVIAGSRVGPGDDLIVLGDSGSAFRKSPLTVDFVRARAGGTVCSYTARVADLPANQRSYQLTVESSPHSTGFALQSFTESQLREGVTLRLRRSVSSPAAGG